MLDEHIMLALKNGQFGDAALGIEDAEDGVFVADRRGTISSPIDPNTGPGRQFVGYLIDERRSVGHGPILHRLRHDWVESFADSAGSKSA